MEMQIVEFFKSWSCKFCDVFFNITNIIACDLFFYIAFYVFYWCYNQRFAFKYALVYYISFASNYFIKYLVRRPRPMGATEGGWSFPSGHTQSYSAIVSGAIYEAKKHNFFDSKLVKWDMYITYVVFGILVSIGRMYFGQHYLSDVIAGLMFGLIVTVVATFLIDWLIEKCKGTKITLEKILIFLIPLIIAGYIVVASTNIFTDIGDLDKLYRFVGLSISTIIGFFVNKKWIKYDTEDTLKNKIIKGSVGTSVLIVYYILFIYEKAINALLPVYYFIMGVLATIVLPYIFKTIKNPPITEEN